MGGISLIKEGIHNPQGSNLGPPLWNIMYDGIFWLKVPKEAKIIGFADDVAVIMVAKFKE